MSDAKERVLKELQELNDRMNKLREFHGSMRFNALKSRQMKFLLKTQYSVMHAYCCILEARLDCWEEEL
jgi:predicted RNase H-like nuclease